QSGPSGSVAAVELQKSLRPSAAVQPGGCRCLTLDLPEPARAAAIGERGSRACLGSVGIKQVLAIAVRQVAVDPHAIRRIAPGNMGDLHRDPRSRIFDDLLAQLADGTAWFQHHWTPR